MSFRQQGGAGMRVTVAYCVIVLALVVGLYGRVFKYPHFQDDWRVVNYVTFADTGDALYDFFDPGGDMFYRPLSMTYHVIMTRLFGTNAVGFHAVAMILMYLNSLFVAWAMFRLMGDRLLGMLTGMLYAAATSLHMVPMLWAVGINELAGMFCFLSAVLLFDREKYLATALFCLMGLLFKEAVWFLPLFLLALLRRKGDFSSFREFSRKAIAALWPVAVVATVYVFAKQFNPVPTSLVQEHPYAASVTPLVIARNLLLYLKWLFEVLAPPLIESAVWLSLFIWMEAHLRLFILIFLASCVMVYAVLLIDAKRKGAGSRSLGGVFKDLAFLDVWFLLSLFAPLCLVQHQIRYYLIYALIPFLYVSLWFARALLRQVLRNPRLVVICLCLLVSLNVVFAARFIRGREGVAHAEGLEGIDAPFWKGRIVNIVQRDLLKLFPDLPQGSTIVLGGFNLWPIRQSDAVQVWYADPTINVYPFHRVVMGEGSLVVKRRMPWSQRHEPPDLIPLDPAATYFLRLEDDHLVEFSDEVRVYVGEIGRDE